jgi:hypothetical protein
MPIPTITPVVVPEGGALHSLHFDSVVVVAPSFVGEDLPFLSEELAAHSKVFPLSSLHHYVLVFCVFYLYNYLV